MMALQAPAEDAIQWQEGNITRAGNEIGLDDTILEKVGTGRDLTT